MKRLPLALLAALPVLAILALLPGSSAPALAAPAGARVEVVNDQGTGSADVRYRTALTLTGRGFQVVRGGFGGIYVMFGWVRDPRGGAWRPSRGGLTGDDYQYIPDSENAAENQGYLKFVAFPGSSTASEANAVLSGDGSFSVDLTVPGPVFESVDREGNVGQVDCRRVTCGVITIGAHGVRNAANETFTPVPFGEVYDTGRAAEAQPDAAGGSGDSGGATDPAGPGSSAATDPAEPAVPDAAVPGSTGPAVDSAIDDTTDSADTTARRGARADTTVATVVEVDRATAVAGHALIFTGRGFLPGEQVVAVLDDGSAALGPLLAGASGEVAGVLQLPAELPVGTHEIRLTGAASGSTVLERFPVAASETAAVTSSASSDEGDQAAGGAGWSIGTWFLLGAAVLLVVAALRLAVTLLRRRRARGPVDRMPASGVTA